MKYPKKAGLLIIAVAAIICLVLIIYFATLPTPSSSYSEFYLLNENGKSFNYPAQFRGGDPVHVVLGIINHEDKAAQYTVKIVCGGGIISTVDSGVVDRGQKWEKLTTIDPPATGSCDKLEFYLHLKGNEQPHIKSPLTLALKMQD